MTYLGKIGINKDNKIVTEEKFQTSEQGYTTGKLLDSTECQILLDTGASKSFMSKSHFCIVKYFICYLNLLKDSDDPSRKWTVCEGTFCNPNNSRYTWS